MPLFPRKHQTRSLLAAVAVDGPNARVLITAGPDDPSRGEVLDARRWPATDLSYVLMAAESAHASPARVTALTAVTGDDVDHIGASVPQDLMDSPESTRRLAALAGTAWANEDVLASLNLTAGLDPDTPGSDRYLIAAAPTSDIRQARARVPLDDCHVTTMGRALDRLLRSAHAGALDSPHPILAILANESYIAGVVIERRRTVVAWQHPVLDLLATIDASTPVTAEDEDETIPDAEILEFELDYSYSPPARPAATRTTSRVDVTDATSMQAAIRYALRKIVAIHAAAHGDDSVTAIEQVYVTGAAVETASAISVVEEFFGSQASVMPLAANRVIHIRDSEELAEELAVHLHRYADACALVAAARWSTRLDLDPDAATILAEPVAARSPASNATLTRARAIAPAAIASLLLAGAWIGGRAFLIANEGDRIARAYAAERARAEHLAEATKQRKQEEARLAEVEQNNAASRDVALRQHAGTAFHGALVAIYGENPDAKLDSLQMDRSGGVTLIGTALDTDTAEALFRAVGSYGTGQFSALEAKHETITTERLVTPDGREANSTDETAAPTKVDRVRYTLRAKFTALAAPIAQGERK